MTSFRTDFAVNSYHFLDDIQGNEPTRERAKEVAMKVAIRKVKIGQVLNLKKSTRCRQVLPALGYVLRTKGEPTVEVTPVRIERHLGRLNEGRVRQPCTRALIPGAQESPSTPPAIQIMSGVTHRREASSIAAGDSSTSLVTGNGRTGLRNRSLYAVASHGGLDEFDTPIC